LRPEGRVRLCLVPSSRQTFANALQLRRNHCLSRPAGCTRRIQRSTWSTRPPGRRSGRDHRRARTGGRRCGSQQRARPDCYGAGFGDKVVRNQ
jgi:hypothetical protein